jgi:hypothetical protein
VSWSSGRQVEHAQFLRIPATHDVQREAAARQVIDRGALLGGHNRVNRGHMGRAKDRGMIGHRAHAGSPSQGIVAGAVEIGGATEAPPARHRNQSLKAGPIRGGDDVAAVRPSHFEMPRRCRRGAAVADIGPEHTELQPVVAVERVQDAAIGAHCVTIVARILVRGNRSRPSVELAGLASTPRR